MRRFTTTPHTDDLYSINDGRLIPARELDDVVLIPESDHLDRIGRECDRGFNQGIRVAASMIRAHAGKKRGQAIRDDLVDLAADVDSLARTGVEVPSTIRLETFVAWTVLNLDAHPSYVRAELARIIGEAIIEANAFTHVTERHDEFHIRHSAKVRVGVTDVPTVRVPESPQDERQISES